jgi:DNA primase
VDHKAKYLNTRQNDLFDKSRNLFAIDRARAAMQERKRAILVEGYTDCLAAHQAGFTETVATCGTAFTEAQVELIRRYCAEVVLLFDSDDAGEKAADRALQLAVPRHLAVRLARLPDGQDPCDFLAAQPPERFREVIDAATDALEFKWQQLKTDFRAEQSDARRHEAVREFVRFVGEASSSGSMDAIQRGQLGTQVAQLLNLPPAEIQSLMNRAARRPSKGARGDAPATDSTAETGAFLQNAWSILLGVILNEPGHCADVPVELDSSRIGDDRDRRITEIVRSLANTLGEFTIKDVIGACGEDPAVAVRIAELAERGERRGNYAATLEGALERIHRETKLRRSESAKEDWRGADDPEQARSALARLAEFSKEHRHYLPKRMIGFRAAARHPESPPGSAESVPTETK